MNRLIEFWDPFESEQPDDFYEVICGFAAFVISKETAIEIERWLDCLPPPRWVVFHDLAGARHRLPLDRVVRISECTAAQRAAWRAFERARRLEEKKDRRPWEDD